MIARSHHSKDKVKLLPYTFVLNRMKHTAYYDIKLMASSQSKTPRYVRLTPQLKQKKLTPIEIGRLKSLLSH